MSVPAGPDAGEYRVPGGLLEKLMAVVRPEFRADVLAFDAADPVFGSPACMVGGCGRPASSRGLCVGHEGRWRSCGRPPLEEFAATTAAEFAQSALLHCRVPGCGYGVAAMNLCNRHARHWIKAGRPGIDGWLGALPPGLAAAGPGVRGAPLPRLGAAGGNALPRPPARLDPPRPARHGRMAGPVRGLPAWPACP